MQSLTDEQADELITALIPSLSAKDWAAVRTRWDGVPFFIEQLVRALGEKTRRRLGRDAGAGGAV